MPLYQAPLSACRRANKLPRIGTGRTRKILKLPEVAEKIASQGGEIVAGSAAEFAAFLPADTAAWARLIKEANVKVD